MNAPILKVENLHLSFGGIRAIDGVSLEVDANEFLAIIGTNGSGKTTFLNVCTGYLKPQKGRILFRGQDISVFSPRAIARLGVARAFQIPQLFTQLSVIENLLFSIAGREGLRFREALVPVARPAYVSEAKQILGLLGLEEVSHQPVSSLPEGLRKLLDIGMALALRPQLVFLDEPTSGVSSLEKYGIMETIMRAFRESRTTAVFVEHDMEIVRRYAHRVIVWHDGKIVAQGSPIEVFNNPQVLEKVTGVT